MARNYYDILQITPDASVNEIQHAYRRLARRYHPDHNPGTDAAAQMAALNKAYEALHHPSNPGASRRDELTRSIIGAARAVILRKGWTESTGDGNVAVFETGNPRIRIVLTGDLNSESLLQIAGRHRGLSAVLAVHIDGPIGVGSQLTVIDLMHAEQHGAAIPDGPCKSLLSGFL